MNIAKDIIEKKAAGMSEGFRLGEGYQAPPESLWSKFFGYPGRNIMEGTSALFNNVAAAPDKPTAIMKELASAVPSTFGGFSAYAAPAGIRAAISSYGDHLDDIVTKLRGDQGVLSLGLQSTANNPVKLQTRDYLRAGGRAGRTGGSAMAKKIKSLYSTDKSRRMFSPKIVVPLLLSAIINNQRLRNSFQGR